MITQGLSASTRWGGCLLLRLVGQVIRCLVVGGVLLLSCQHSSETGSQSDTLATERLTGTYLLADVRPRVEEQGRPMASDSTVVAYAKLLEYSLYTFSADGTGQHLQAGLFRKGHYTLKNNTLRFEDQLFQDVRLGRQSLSMRAFRLVNGRSFSLRCTAYRLQLTTDDLRFWALAKVAFTHPTQPETEAQIRERVKNSLYFYSVFFRAIYKNRFNQFKPAAISLPIRYYRAGIRVPAKFDSTASWTRVYATTRDAEKAHSLFRTAAKAIKKYPVGKSMIQEYSIVLEQMADTL